MLEGIEYEIDIATKKILASKEFLSTIIQLSNGISCIQSNVDNVCRTNFSRLVSLRL